MLNEHEILIEVLSRLKNADKWNDQPFERIKRISNSKVGDIGQDFVEALCIALGCECEFPLNRKGRRARQNPWDIKISNVTFELKTATEDTNGAFQFNHIRFHRRYDALICLGIAPASIYVGAWSKADITTGKAGNLVTMEKGANASYRLSKRPDQLSSITEFENLIMNVVTDPGA